MTIPLTPYDTGDRLEPQPWSLHGPSLMTLLGIRSSEPGPIDPDRYGYVDLDNDESNTVFTLVGKRRDDSTPGYLLNVSRYDDSSAVEIDGDRVLVLDEDTLAGLHALVELAHRGRDDFQHQAETTRDYSEEDIAAADDAWHLAQQTVMTIQEA